MSDVQFNITPCQPTLEDRPVPYRVGLVLLSTDHTTERDFARLVDPADVGVYANRIVFENPANKENLLRTGPRLTDGAAQILPDEDLDVLIYSCTSASAVLGNELVAKQMNAAKPNATCVTPSSAAFDAFAAVGARRVSVLTPYTAHVTGELCQYFAANGLDVVSAQCMGISDDREIARVSEDCIIESAIAAMASEAEALFVSCTALRSAGCVAQIEDKIGKPVVTSNQAMIWRTLRHLGLKPKIGGIGQLFET